MYHVIEIRENLAIDLEISPKDYLARTIIAKGSRFRVQLKPYVVEAMAGEWLEVADLFFIDGTTVRGVPFAYFEFVEDSIAEV